jgi:hypothetical protein
MDGHPQRPEAIERLRYGETQADSRAHLRCGCDDDRPPGLFGRMTRT